METVKTIKCPECGYTIFRRNVHGWEIHECRLSSGGLYPDVSEWIGRPEFSEDDGECFYVCAKCDTELDAVAANDES